MGRKKIIELVFLGIWIITGGILLFFWVKEIALANSNSSIIVLGYITFIGILLWLFKSLYISKNVAKLESKQITGIKNSTKEELVEVNYNELLRIQKKGIKRVVSELFDSIEFKTAILTHIPTGNLDENSSNYLRFILASLEKRKADFKSTMRYFLVTASILTLFFSMVVLYFGYTLIESDSVGFNKTLKELVSISRDLPEKFQKDLSKRQTILADVYIKKTNALNEILTEVEVKIVPPSIPSLINQDHDISDLANQAIEIKKKYENKNSEGKNTTLDNKIKKIDAYIQSLDQEGNNFITREREIQALILDLETSIKDVVPTAKKISQDNYLSEFIKRIAIGLIVFSFFITVIRFCINQFKSNYQQMIAAEFDSLQIRKVYSALQDVDDPEIKKLIYTAFFNKTIIGLNKNEMRSLDVNELLKSVFEVLKKK